METEYLTSGTCARKIKIVVEDNKIQSVEFVGGCGGNTQGVAALIKGMDLNEAVSRLKGIRCGTKPTSCPDQLALALEACLNQSAE